MQKLLDDLTKYEASYYKKWETISIPVMWLQPLSAYLCPYPHKHTSNMSLLKYRGTWNSCSLNLSFPCSCPCFYQSCQNFHKNSDNSPCRVWCSEIQTTKPIAQNTSIAARYCTAVSWYIYICTAVRKAAVSAWVWRHCPLKTRKLIMVSGKTKENSSNNAQSLWQMSPVQ